MQNRNMFLYRRQGPKKRPKSGTPRKNRNPQKGLPTSARELLPIIQPATKALAQMLAGRSAASGQLGHARAVLAQTERLVAERAHNRLNPAEREEFFEQVARLRLTLSDADSEAEFQAAEEQTPSPPPVPVDRERLKAMALALTSSSSNAPANGHLDESGRVPSAAGSGSEEPSPNQDEASVSTAEDAINKPDQRPANDDESEEFDGGAIEDAPAPDKRPSKAGQLRLPREAADKLGDKPVTLNQTSARRKPKIASSAKSRATSPKTAARTASPAKTEDEAGSTESPGTANAKGLQKLPKGWIIDDEGFVVPGPRG